MSGFPFESYGRDIQRKGTSLPLSSAYPGDRRPTSLHLLRFLATHKFSIFFSRAPPLCHVSLFLSISVPVSVSIFLLGCDLSRLPAEKMEIKSRYGNGNDRGTLACLDARYDTLSSDTIALRDGRDCFSSTSNLAAYFHEKCIYIYIHIYILSIG